MIKRGIDEYRRQVDNRSLVMEQSRILRDLIDSRQDTLSRILPSLSLGRSGASLLIITPLIEVAWANKSVGMREFDALVKIAEIYGMVEHQAAYDEFIRRINSKPSDELFERAWQQIYNFRLHLSVGEDLRFGFGLLTQAQFIAEQNQSAFLAFCRRLQVKTSEQKVLEKMVQELKKEVDLMQRNRAAAVRHLQALSSPQTTLADNTGSLEKLLFLIPMVQVAWAEGRVTRREKQLIFAEAEKLGLASETREHQTLSRWLETPPDDELYEASIAAIRRRWQTMEDDSKDRERYNLLSNCTDVAEISGGGADSDAGGSRICPEEIAAVKQIARRLVEPSLN
jgi:hypothetical protein